MTFGIIRAELTIKGGTKGLAGVIGEQPFGTFDLLWESSPKGDEGTTPTLNGTLELVFYSGSQLDATR